MVPNYAPSVTLKKTKIKVPRLVAEKLAEKREQFKARFGERAADAEAGAAPLNGSAPDSNGSSSTAAGNGNGKGPLAGSNGSAPPAGSSAQQAGPAAAAATASPAAAEAAAASPAAAEAAAAAAPGGAAVAAPPSPAPSAGPAGPQDDLVEVEHEFPASTKQHPLVAAMHRLQMEKAASNASLGIGPASEGLLLFTFHLAEEMLLRAVLLVVLMHWFSDTLYALGVDDALWALGGDLHVAVPQVRGRAGGPRRRAWGSGCLHISLRQRGLRLGFHTGRAWVG